jgi:hypothetical protein
MITREQTFPETSLPMKNRLAFVTGGGRACKA